MSARRTVCVFVFFLAACAPRESRPAFVSLLALPLERSGSGIDGLTPGPGLRILPQAEREGVWIEHDLHPEDWRTRSDGWLGLDVPAGHEQGDLELHIAGESRRFVLRAGELLLRQAEPPPAAVLRCFTRRTRPGIYGGALLPVWPGEELTWSLDVPGECELSLQSLTLGVRGFQLAGELRLEVELDGVSLAVLTVPTSTAGGLVHHRVPLPRADEAYLRLRLSGAPVPLWIVSPILTPRAAAPDSPSPRQRPDIIVILADTFRADLLAAYGGKGGCVPRLDALAARSRRFLAARSTSTWTLPAHASLFTGLWPAQHGAEKPSRTFDPSLATLAEALHAAGYRTGAVTDGGYVTRAYGFEQGFEWFREVQVKCGANLRDTLAAADSFLAADDGRPTFLFVHTYRVHSPYRRDEETLAAEFHALRKRLSDEERAGGSNADSVSALRDLYEEGARELDGELGAWLERCESAGRFEHGLLVFTSDHGEAFNEHGEIFHAHAPHEEELRIPLLFHGAGIEAGDVRWGVSLVDLFPTLARLAGASIPLGLPGRDLLVDDNERMLYASVYHDDMHDLAAVIGARKLLARHDVQADFARGLRTLYDLERDPHELIDTFARPGGEEFAAGVARAYAEAATLRGAAPELDLAPDDQDALRALGYGR
jgi:arylsulfatase A-like enzyme